MGKIKAGTIFEIKLNIGKFVYLCCFDEYLFGLFNIVSEKQIDIKEIKNSKIIDYKDCLSPFKRDIITDGKITKEKCNWVNIGEIDLSESNIFIPDLAIFDPNKSELSYKKCIILRGWKPELNYKKRGWKKEKVTIEEYKKVLNTGLTYGTIDNFIIYENYITENIENIINNKPMNSSKHISTFE